MDDCIFCRIGRREIASQAIYEDSSAIAFLDIKPHARGHTVVIPKKHALTAFDLAERELRDFITAVRNTMLRIREVLKPDGFNVGWNQGTAGGQMVPHLHLHIFPRYHGDGGGSMHSIIRNPGGESVEEVAKLFEN